MIRHNRKRRFIYAVTVLSLLSALITCLAIMLSHAVNAESAASSNEALPKVIEPAQVIHSKVIHRSIIEQLSVIERDASGYLPATLTQLSNTADNNPDALVTEARYIGEITTTNGQRYSLDIELLQIAGEWFDLPFTLTPINNNGETS